MSAPQNYKLFSDSKGLPVSEDATTLLNWRSNFLYRKIIYSCGISAVELHDNRLSKNVFCTIVNFSIHLFWEKMLPTMCFFPIKSTQHASVSLSLNWRRNWSSAETHANSHRVHMVPLVVTSLCLVITSYTWSPYFQFADWKMLLTQAFVYKFGHKYFAILNCSTHMSLIIIVWDSRVWRRFQIYLYLNICADVCLSTITFAYFCWTLNLCVCLNSYTE